MTRPAVPFPAPAGYEWRVEADTSWSTDVAKVAPRCRFFVSERVPDRRGSRSVAHGAPIVAALLRRFGKTRGRWWGYCAEHLYGRWIEDGVVLDWRLRKIA